MATLDVIIRQMILAAFRSANITSASPGHTNHFVGVDTQGGLEMIGTSGEINDAIRQAVDDILKNPQNAEDLSKDVTDAAEKTGKSKEATAVGLVSKGISTAKNPASIVAMGLQFLPHAVLVSFALSLAPMIFEELTRPGGLLDLRFKRILEDEFNAFLSRQTQKDTEMGTRQVIIQSKTGFTALNGSNNYNSIRGIREGGINKERQDRLGMVDHTKGVFD